MPDRAPMVERWSSRKFAAMVFFELMFIVLLVQGHLPVEAFVSLTYLLLGGYFVVNGAQHIWEKK
jgi:hypothetical protein